MNDFTNKILEILDLSNQIKELATRKRQLLEELQADGMDKEIVCHQDQWYTVSIKDNMNEDGTYSGMAYISRYSLGKYKRKGPGKDK